MKKIKLFPLLINVSPDYISDTHTKKNPDKNRLSTLWCFHQNHAVSNVNNTTD